ncbi:MAG: hypothetical protein ACRCX2_09345 [Paraclostridium sp.]
MIDILEEVFKTGEMIENDRDVQSVFLAISEETGELAREVRVLTAHDCYKEAGEDGIIGETCDIIIAALDLLFVSGFTKEQARETIIKKLNKWYEKTKEDKMIKIKIFSLKKMLENGCFFDKDNTLLYDGNEEVINNFDYEKTYEDYKSIHIWSALSEGEIPYTPFEKEVVVDEKEIDDDFLYITTDAGSIQIPNIEGVFYERC